MTRWKCETNITCAPANNDNSLATGAHVRWTRWMCIRKMLINNRHVAADVWNGQKDSTRRHKTIWAVEIGNTADDSRKLYSFHLWMHVGTVVWCEATVNLKCVFTYGIASLEFLGTLSSSNRDRKHWKMIFILYVVRWLSSHRILLLSSVRSTHLFVVV